MKKQKDKRKLYLGAGAGVFVVLVIVLAIVFSGISPTEAETAPDKKDVSSGFSTSDSATATLDLDGEKGNKDSGDEGQ